MRSENMPKIDFSKLKPIVTEGDATDGDTVEGDAENQTV